MTLVNSPGPHLKTSFRKSAWDRLFDWIFGYDLFISYSRIGWGEDYAVDLAKRLTAPPYDFKCFLDAQAFETGASWRQQGRRSLRKSSKILLLLTSEVHTSAGVRDELEYNISLGEKRKPISIIDVGNAWSIVRDAKDFASLLAEDGADIADSLRIVESQRSKPSEAVLERIKNDFAIRTENAKRSYALAVASAVLLALTCIAAIFGVVAWYEQIEADTRRKEAQTKQSLLVATLARNESANGHPVAARFLALKALPKQTWAPERPLVSDAMGALLVANRMHVSPKLVLSDPSDGPGDGGIKSAQFVFDGGQIVTKSWFGRVRIWDAKNGALLKEIGKGYGQFPVTSLHGSAPLLALSIRNSAVGHVDIWNTAEARIVAILESGQPVEDVVFNDGDLAAIRGVDGKVRFWRLATGREVARLEETATDTLRMRFSGPNELVTISRGGIVRTWSAEDGRKLATFDTKLGLIDRVELSPRAELAVIFHSARPTDYKITKSRANDNEPWIEKKECSPCILEIWDLRKGTSLGTFTEHRDALFNTVSISPTLQTIAVLDPQDAKRILLWDVASRAPGAALTGHSSNVSSIEFSPSGAHLGTTSWDRTGRVWDTTTGSELVVLRGHGDYANTISFDRAGRNVLTGSTDAKTFVWPLVDSAVSNLVAPPSPNLGVAINGNGTLLAVSGGSRKVRPRPIWERALQIAAGCEDKCVVRVWDLATRQIAFDFLSDSPQALLRFHPSKKLLIATNGWRDPYYSSSSTDNCEDCTVTAWDLQTGARAYATNIKDGQIADMELSSDGRLIGLATDAGHTLVLDSATGKQVARLAGSKSPIKKIAFHPDGLRLLSASWDNKLRLWDIKKEKLIRTFEGHRDKIGFVQFNARGTRFVSSSADRTARLWDTESGKLITEFIGHTQALTQAIFADGDRRVITAAEDNSVIVWNARDGTRIQVLSGHIDSGAFSGVKSLALISSQVLLSFGTDGSARVWDLERGVAAGVLTPPTKKFSAIALSPLLNEIALIRSDGDVRLQSFEQPNAYEKIDQLSAQSIPIAGSRLQEELSRRYGLAASQDWMVPNSSDQGALLARVNAASRSYESALRAGTQLTVEKLRQLADAGAVEAHVQLSARAETRNAVDDIARALFHHRVAERLFIVLDRIDDANFHAARRVSLAGLLPRNALSKAWRGAEQWQIAK